MITAARAAADAAAASRAATSEGLCQFDARVKFVLPRLTEKPTAALI